LTNRATWHKDSTEYKYKVMFRLLQALKTAALFGALEHVYDSFLLLTDPEPDEAALTEDELDDLLAMPGLQEYLHP